nr:uncharacterized protein LOC117276186 [Nicotiana tomentosiformis]
MNTTYEPDFAAQVIFNDLYNKPNKEEILDPFFIDLKATSEPKQQRYTMNHSDSLTLESEKEETKNTTTLEPGKQPIETDGEKKEMQAEKNLNSMAIIKIGKYSGNNYSVIEKNQAMTTHQEGPDIDEWVVEDAEPLQQQNLLLDKEMDTTLWVHQNLIKLGKMFGVDFLGHEEEALELLMQIDSSRKARKMEAEVNIKKSRFKGSQDIDEWVVEDAEPLQQQNLLLDKEMDTTLWVHQNLIKLGKMFGVDFLGHEEEALELLMQIDSSRKARKMEAEVNIKKSRFKGSQELKGLATFDLKFKSNENRSRGRALFLIDQ